MPDGVTSIGDGAFYKCNALTSVNIGSGVTFIGSDAFFACNALTGIYITDISAWCKISFKNAFSVPPGKLYLNNELLTELVIPDEIISINNYTFYNQASITKVILSDNVTSIGEAAFYGCSSLTSIDISDSVTSIGKEAFKNCSELASITIGDGVTDIPAFLCENCTQLSEVKIGKNVKSLGVKSFFIGKDTWINKFYCYASSPPELRDNSIYDFHYAPFYYFYKSKEETRIKTLYVPERSGQTYRESDWGYCFDELVE